MQDLLSGGKSIFYLPLIVDQPTHEIKHLLAFLVNARFLWNYMIVDKMRVDATVRFSCDTFLQGHQDQRTFSSFFLSGRLEPPNKLKMYS